jgi:hypothetical protein
MPPPGAHTMTSEQWQAPNIAPQAMVMDLVEVYFEVIYPV